MSTYCNQCGQYHESLTVCPNWKVIGAFSTPTQPKLETAGERAELQVSLLNALGSAIAELKREMLYQFEIIVTHQTVPMLERAQRIEAQQREQAETLKTYKAVLEVHQGLLVKLDESLNYVNRANAHDFQALTALLASRLSERPVTVKRKPPLRPVSRKKRKR